MNWVSFVSHSCAYRITPDSNKPLSAFLTAFSYDLKAAPLPIFRGYCDQKSSKSDVDRDTLVSLISGSGLWLASPVHCPGIAPASFCLCFLLIFLLCAFHLWFAAWVAICVRFVRSTMAFSARLLNNMPSVSVILLWSFRSSSMRTNAAFGAPHRRDNLESSRRIGPSCSYIRHRIVMYTPRSAGDNPDVPPRKSDG